jgi:hypothetical protein
MSSVHRLDVSADYVRRAMTTIECEESTTVVKLPAGPRLPPAVQGVVALANRRIAREMLRRRYVVWHGISVTYS